MLRTPLIAFAAAAVLLTGCSSKPAQFGTATQYACSNGFEAGAQFSSDGEVMNLVVHKKVHTLKREVSASGAKYGNKEFVFWEKAGEAVIEHKGNLMGQSCKDLKGEQSPLATVSGTVNYKPRIALPPTAVLEVKLRDVSKLDEPSVALGEFSLANPGQVPIPFALKYDSRKVQQHHTYGVQAIIRDGERVLFVNDPRQSLLPSGTNSLKPLEVWVLQAAQ